MSNSVCITACFESLCSSDPLTFDPARNFALTKLIVPSGYKGMVYDEINHVYYPVDQVWETRIDPDTGCFTTCPIPCNSNFNVKDAQGRPATYYEMAIFVNGTNSGTERFVLDCESNTYPESPNCVNLADLTWVSPGSVPSPFHCQLVKSCETPWTGTGSSCISVTSGDNPVGSSANGHAPTFDIVVSDAPGNIISCTPDGVYAANKQTFVTVSDTACIDLAISGTGEQTDPYNISAIPTLSGIGDNMLSCTPTGLYASPTIVTVSGDQCLDLELSGVGTVSAPYEISGTVLVSPQETNLLVCGSDGLFVSPPVLLTEDGTCSTLGIVGSGTIDSPYTLTSAVLVSPEPGNLIECTETGLLTSCESVQDCVGSGFTNGLYYDDTTNTFNARISGDANNIVSLGIDRGLYVPAPDGSETKLTSGSGSTCFTTIVSGLGTLSDPYVIDGSIHVNPATDNALRCTPDGLYAPMTSVTTTSGSCLTLGLSGIGSVYDPYVLSGDILVSPSQTNALTCTSTGLYVPTPDGSETKIAVTDSSCINLSLVGTGTDVDGYNLSAQLVVSVNADNLLQCTPGGLLLSCEQVQDCVGGAVTQGLVYDDVANTFSVRVSGDSRNCLEFGSDSGLYVRCPDGSETKVQSLDTPCISVDVAGAGTSVDPYRISATPIVSSATDNLLQCTPAGLFAKSYALQSVNTNCIDTAISGDGSLATPWVVTSELKLSGNPDNLIECTPSGLSLTCEQVQDCVGGAFATGLRYDDPTNTFHARLSNDTNNVMSFGSDGGLFAPSYDGSETKLQVLDNACFDLSLSGNGTLGNPYVLSGSPIIQVPDPETVDCACDNWLECKPGGLYVSAPQLDVVSTSCLTLSVDGDASCKNPWVLTADVRISSDDDNILECTQDGLRVLPPVVDGSETKVQVAGSNCIDLHINGSGTSVNPYVVTADVVISSDSNNVVKCFSNGLYAEKTFVGVSSNDCLTMTVVGDGSFSNPYTLSGSPVISPIAGNALTCTDDGLYSPITAVQGVSTSCMNVSVIGDGTISNPYIVSSTPIISADASNLLECGISGLAVPCEAVQDCIGSAVTQGLIYDDVASTFSVRISGDAGNVLSFGTDTGLYVPLTDGSETKIMTSSGNCIDLAVSGIGTSGNPYILHADVNLDQRPDNIAQCTEDGLFVPSSLLQLDIADSNCIDLALTGNGTISNPYVLSSQLIVDPVQNNLIKCTSSGLRLTCEEVQDCVGDSFGSGLAYDDVNNIYSVRVSGDAGNCINYGSDLGIYAQCADGSETKINVVDTNCIELGISGSGQALEPYVISADVRISSDVGNNIECTPNGLFVGNAWSCETIQDCVGYAFSSGLTYDDTGNLFRASISNDTGNVLSFGSDQGLYVPAAELIQFTSFSTDCIHLEINGAGSVSNPFRIEATPRIKQAQGSECANILECTGEGLYVPAPKLDVDNTDACIALSVAGTGACSDPYILAATAIIHPSTDNILQCGAQGLFVPAPNGSETKLQVGDTSCIDLSIIGSGTETTPYIITADIEISVDANNGISCRSNGLFVEKTIIASSDTPCLEIDISGTGTQLNPYVVTGTPILASDPTNLLECTDDGLFAPATVLTTISNSCFTQTVSGLGTEAAPYIVTGNIVISPDDGNLITCTENGLYAQTPWTCELIQDCVGSGFTSGLVYDDANQLFRVQFSGDLKNIISLGSDGGLYVPQIHVEGVNTPCAEIDISGCGTPGEPLVISVSPVVSPDTCNLLMCEPSGLRVRKVVSFEIGQQCALDSKPPYPYMWRAYESGEITFKVAGLPLFSAGAVDSDTHFEIVDKNGNTIFSDMIAHGEEYKILDLPTIQVLPGDAFGVVAVAPYPPTPASGLVIQAEFACGE